MKAAYELLDRARKLVADPESGITVAKLATESGIHDPTLRALLKPGKTNRTLDNLGLLEKALTKIDPTETGDKKEKTENGSID